MQHWTTVSSVFIQALVRLSGTMGTAHSAQNVTTADRDLPEGNFFSSPSPRGDVVAFLSEGILLLLCLVTRGHDVNKTLPPVGVIQFLEAEKARLENQSFVAVMVVVVVAYKGAKAHFHALKSNGNTPRRNRHKSARKRRRQLPIP